MTEAMERPQAELFSRLPPLQPDGYATHEVMNQATPLVGHNAFSGDRLLSEIAGREPISWAVELLTVAGWTVASAHVAQLARDANRHGRSSRATTGLATASTRSTSIRPGTS